MQGVVNSQVFLTLGCVIVSVQVLLLASTEDSGNGLQIGVSHFLLPNRTLIALGQSYAQPDPGCTKSIVIPVLLFPSLPCS